MLPHASKLTWDSICQMSYTTNKLEVHMEFHMSNCKLWRMCYFIFLRELNSVESKSRKLKSCMSLDVMKAVEYFMSKKREVDFECHCMDLAQSTFD